MTIGSLELSFVLQIIYLLYIVLLIPVTVKINLFTTNSIITRQLFLDDW